MSRFILFSLSEAKEFVLSKISPSRKFRATGYEILYHITSGNTFKSTACATTEEAKKYHNEQYQDTVLEGTVNKQDKFISFLNKEGSIPLSNICNTILSLEAEEQDKALKAYADFCKTRPRLFKTKAPTL